MTYAEAMTHARACANMADVHALLEAIGNDPHISNAAYYNIRCVAVNEAHTHPEQTHGRLDRNAVQEEIDALHNSLMHALDKLAACGRATDAITGDLLRIRSRLIYWEEMLGLDEIGELKAEHVKPIYPELWIEE